MDLSSYIPVLVQIVVAIAIPVVIIVASHIFGQRAKTNKIKDSAYECGITAEGNPHTRYGAKFYLVAMLFVIFDIEVVFMLPIAMSYPKVAAGLPVLLFGTKSSMSSTIWNAIPSIFPNVRIAATFSGEAPTDNAPTEPHTENNDAVFLYIISR